MPASRGRHSTYNAHGGPRGCRLDGMDHKSRQATREQTWTFLTNHAVVLLLIADSAGTSVAALGRAAGISTRATQMIVADLCRAGYVERSRVGRGNRYAVNESLPLRHRAVRERATVAALLAMPMPPADA